MKGGMAVLAMLGLVLKRDRGTGSLEQKDKLTGIVYT